MRREEEEKHECLGGPAPVGAPPSPYHPGRCGESVVYSGSDIRARRAAVGRNTWPGSEGWVRARTYPDSKTRAKLVSSIPQQLGNGLHLVMYI